MSPTMNALARLGGAEPPHMPEAVRAFGINDRPSWLARFSRRPPIGQRIAALKAREPATIRFRANPRRPARGVVLSSSRHVKLAQGRRGDDGS